MELGASQGHTDGLTVPRLVIFERTNEIVHTHAKRSSQFFGRISTSSTVSLTAPLSAACHGSADGYAGPVSALCAGGDLQAGQPPAEGREPACCGGAGTRSVCSDLEGLDYYRQCQGAKSPQLIAMAEKRLPLLSPSTTAVLTRHHSREQTLPRSVALRALETPEHGAASRSATEPPAPWLRQRCEAGAR